MVCLSKPILGPERTASHHKPRLFPPDTPFCALPHALDLCGGPMVSAGLGAHADGMQLFSLKKDSSGKLRAIDEPRLISVVALDVVHIS